MKRLRSSSESNNFTARKVSRMLHAPKPLIVAKKRETIDDEKIYIASEPYGRNYKDSMITLQDLTNMLCPVVKYKISHYGFNFAGQHKYQPIADNALSNTYAGEQLDDLYSDARRFTTGNLGQLSAADTIAWTAGTQAWFEHISLPGTWDYGTGGVLENEILAMPSLQGLIQAGASSLNYLGGSSFGTELEKDFMINYSGGSQHHTFVNQNEHEIFYEAWELIPRDIVDDYWKGFSENKAYFRNLHQIQALCNQNNIPVNHSNTNSSAVNDVGTYDEYLYDNTTSYLNSNGQRILHKNQLGFRLTNSNVDLHHMFRVSQPQRGSVKSGGVLHYTLKHGPFKLQNSVWRRYAWGERGETTNPASSFSRRTPQLVPCSTKILCIRFWSELGNRNNTGESNDPNNFKMNFDSVSNVQGRIIHTVHERHNIRCVPIIKMHTTIEKSFLKQDYLPSSDTVVWKTINDETNTQSTTIDT